MLSQEQRETLDQFQRVIPNLQLSRPAQIQLLQSFDWNLERSILHYYESDPTLAVPSQQDNNTNIIMTDNPFARLLRGNNGSSEENIESTQSMPGAFPVDEPIREPSKLHQYFNKCVNFTLQLIVNVVLVPIYVIYKFFGYVFAFMMSIALPLLGHNRLNYKVIKRNNDPTDVARRFIIRFDETIGNTFTRSNPSSAGGGSYDQNLVPQNTNLTMDRPDFLECAYSQALFYIKKNARWLLVYIDSDDNQDSYSFINDVMINPTLLTFLKDRDIICWGGDFRESESFQICNQFKINKLPFLGLLCLTQNQIPTASGVSNSPSLLSLVCKIQGYQSIDTVISKLNRSYEKFNPNLLNIRAEVERNLEAKQMRQMQDDAYQRSLQQDRAKKLQRQMEKEQAKRQAELQQLKQQWFKWRKANLIPEAPTRQETARIAIRLPNGERVQYKFNKSCKIEEIYAFIECNYLNDIEIDETETYMKPIGFEYDYGFKIYNILPRELIDVDYDLNIGDNRFLSPSGNLVVELNS